MHYTFPRCSPIENYNWYIVKILLIEKIVLQLMRPGPQTCNFVNTEIFYSQSPFKTVHKICKFHSTILFIVNFVLQVVYMQPIMQIKQIWHSHWFSELPFNKKVLEENACLHLHNNDALSSSLCGDRFDAFIMHYSEIEFLLEINCSSCCRCKRPVLSFKCVISVIFTPIHVQV